MSVGIVDKSTGDRIQTAGDPLDKVGNLANLTTTAKTDAVAAINEVNGAVGTKQNATDNNLDTTSKTVVGAINEVNSNLTSLGNSTSDYQKHNNLNLEIPTRTNLLNPAKMGGASSDTVGVIDGDTITITTTNKAYGAYNSGSPSVTKYKAGKYYVKCKVISNTLGYGNITLRDSNSTIKSSMRINEAGDFEGILETTEACYFSILTTQSTAASNVLVIEDLILSPFDVAYTPYVPSVEERLEAVELGRIYHVNLRNIELSQLTFTASSGGMFYATIDDVIPANADLMGCIMYGFSDIKADNIFMFSQAESDKKKLLILASNTSFNANAIISLRVSYIISNS